MRTRGRRREGGPRPVVPVDDFEILSSAVADDRSRPPDHLCVYDGGQVSLMLYIDQLVFCTQSSGRCKK